MKNLPGFALSTLLVIILGIVIVGGAGYVAMNPDVLKAPQASVEADASAEADTEAGTGASASGKVSVAWKIEPLGVDGPGKSEVTAIINGKEHLIGTYEGTCAEIGSGASAVSDLLTADGEVAGVTCYYAGGGDEIGIFKTDTGLEVRVGEIAEPTAESPSFRGNFTTKLDLTLKQ